MTINDCIVTVLSDIYGDGLSINDLLFLYYLENGGNPAKSITDAEYLFLIAQGVRRSSITDMWNEFLWNVVGLRGAVPDMQKEFWCILGGEVPDQSLCVTELIFSVTLGEGLIGFNRTPVLDGSGNYGTIKVNGIITPWTVLRVDGNRIYFETTPPLVEGDVVTYSYDPILDGGITNDSGEQACEVVDAPFEELANLEFVTHDGIQVTHNAEDVTYG